MVCFIGDHPRYLAILRAKSQIKIRPADIRAIWFLDEKRTRTGKSGRLRGVFEEKRQRATWRSLDEYSRIKLRKKPARAYKTSQEVCDKEGETREKCQVWPREGGETGSVTTRAVVRIWGVGELTAGLACRHYIFLQLSTGKTTQQAPSPIPIGAGLV